ncbi:MAG: DUF1800 domain-containing protein [Betaproteobacteria bacterium]
MHFDSAPVEPRPVPARPETAAAAAMLAAAALAACGGGGSAAAPPTPPPAPVPPTQAQAARFLLQTQFCASDAEIAAVSAQGYAAWLNAQFNAAPGQKGVDWLDARGYAAFDAHQFYDNTYPADFMVWNQLLTAPDAVRKRLTLALSEFFVASSVGVEVNWRSHAMAQYWDTLSAGALGNFRQLLESVTLNPAMGVYLNVRGNLKENAATGREPDENYAREVMQLFSLGLYQLNLDGTIKTDANGVKLETYAQADISNLAHVFTGYNLDTRQSVDTVVALTGGGTRTIPDTTTVRLPMLLNPFNHSSLAVSFLGSTIAANTEGAAALKAALDTLFNHANVGPFFGRQMIQRLVTSNPSAAYVARVASAFNNNGAGVRGDLKAVFAAILLDDEARNAAGLTQPLFGKVREPIVRFVQWGRTFGVNSAKGSWKIRDLSNPATQLGQSPLQSPSVFNFFRPGYVPPSTALSSSQSVAPEFQLVNEVAVAGYLNYMQGVIRNGIYVPSPEAPGYDSNPATNGYDITASYLAELALVTDAAALVARLSLLLCAGQLSADTQTLIVTALNATAVTAASPDAKKLDRVAAAVLLVMASAEYLIQK